MKLNLCQVAGLLLGVLFVFAARDFIEWTRCREGYYQSFIGEKVRIKFNGHVGYISDSPEWFFGESQWTVRVGERMYLLHGNEMYLIEE